VSQEHSDGNVLLMIKGIISDLPEDRQHTIAESYNKIKSIEKEYGEDAVIAIALRGAEFAAAEEAEV
jgi:hypothetical protein